MATNTMGKLVKTQNIKTRLEAVKRPRQDERCGLGALSAQHRFEIAPPHDLSVAQLARTWQVMVVGLSLPKSLKAMFPIIR